MVLAGPAAAQSPAPAGFEVASVKAFAEAPGVRMGIDTTPGTLTMRGTNLTTMVAWAYNIGRPQVTGPDWVRSQRYEVQAKAGRAATEDEMRPMLCALLEERFRLAVHRETRSMEVLALVLPKGGVHKMTPSKATGPPQERNDPVRGNILEGVTMAQLAVELSGEIETPVVDMTGLAGRWDFTFDVRKYVMALRDRLMGEGKPMNEADAKVMIVQEAMAGELGLKVEFKKAPVEVIVIDRAERIPAAN